MPIIARVNKARNVEHIHRAGADFALSVSQVAGQMLSNRLLRQETLTIDRRLQVLKLPGAPLVGRAPARQGGPLCSVVAVERSGDVVVHFDADFRVRPDDTVFVCGGEEAVRQFVARHGFP